MVSVGELPVFAGRQSLFSSVVLNALQCLKIFKCDSMRSMIISFFVCRKRAYINFEVHAGSALHVDDVRSQVGEEGLQVGGGVPATNIAM